MGTIIKAEPGDAVISTATGRILLNIQGKLSLLKTGGGSGGNRLSAPQEVNVTRGSKIDYTPSPTHDAIVTASLGRFFLIGPNHISIFVDGELVIPGQIIETAHATFTFPVKAGGTWSFEIGSHGGEGAWENTSTYWFFE
jgi:hypothetical protein